MVFRGKRAEGIISFLFGALFGLILAAFFIIAVFLRVKSAAEDSSFQKRFYARDMALLVDSLHAANGDAVIFYQFTYSDLMSLETMLEPDKVSLSDADNSILGKKAPASFLFGHNERIAITPSSLKSGTLLFNMILRDEKIEFNDGTKPPIGSPAEVSPVQ